MAALEVILEFEPIGGELKKSQRFFSDPLPWGFWSDPLLWGFGVIPYYGGFGCQKFVL